jgi:hypothetical protein
VINWRKTTFEWNLTKGQQIGNPSPDSESQRIALDLILDADENEHAAKPEVNDDVWPSLNLPHLPSVMDLEPHRGASDNCHSECADLVRRRPTRQPAIPLDREADRSVEGADTSGVHAP